MKLKLVLVLLSASLLSAFGAVAYPDWAVDWMAQFPNPLATDMMRTENPLFETPSNLTYSPQGNFTLLSWNLAATDLYVGIWRTKYIWPPECTTNLWFGYSLAAILPPGTKTWLDKENIQSTNLIPLSSMTTTTNGTNLIMHCVGSPDYHYFVTYSTNYISDAIDSNWDWLGYFKGEAYFTNSILPKSTYDHYCPQYVTDFHYLLVSFKVNGPDPYVGMGPIVWGDYPINGMGLNDMPAISIVVSKPVYIRPIAVTAPGRFRFANSP